MKSIWTGSKAVVRYEVGDTVRLRGLCGKASLTQAAGLPDSEMKGCWHRGGPVEKIFRDGSYWIRDRKPWKGSLDGTYMRLSLIHI